MRRPLLTLCVLTACFASGAFVARAQQRDSSTSDTIKVPEHKPPARTPPGDTGIVRALYVNRWAAQSWRRMRELIALADSTEINALVIDMKDEFGQNFETTDSMVRRNAGRAGHVPHLAAMLDTLREHRILAIARVVVFKDANGQPKPKALAEFFRAACPRVHAQGARCTADVFGMVASLPGPLEIGQQWSELAPVTDVLLPMVYPSHYPHGSFGVAHPNGAPYTIVDSAVSDARHRDLKLGITSPIHVRPWLQAFTLGSPHYTAEEVAAQKKGVYDAGYDSWTLWSPGSEYHQFVGALEKATVSRKKGATTTTN